MKRNLIITTTLLFITATFLSFKIINLSEIIQSKDNYEAMWKKFEKHLDNSLPESAEKVLDSIEQAALKDKNQVQLLKTVLYRQKVMNETVEGDYEPVYISFAESKMDQLDEVGQAILHCELASIYQKYLDKNKGDILSNIAIDGDLSKVEMKYWDKGTFLKLIDQHYSAALKPEKALKKAKTEDYLVLFENSSETKNSAYEPTMFEFMFHRVANHYKNESSADDLESTWNTDLWWLDDKDFVKADLGDSEKPLIRCLKIFQQLIDLNLGDDKLLTLYNNFKRYEFVNGILDEPERYQEAIGKLMEKYADTKLYPDLSNELAKTLINQYENQTSDSTYFDNYRKALEICEKAITAYPDNAAECKNTVAYIKSPYYELKFNRIQLPNEATPAIIKYKNVNQIDYKIIKVTQEEYDTLQRLYHDDLRKSLNKMTPIVLETIELTEETDFREHGTVIAMPALKEGIYYFVTDKVIMNFQVSNLGFILDKKSDHLEIVTVNRKTGFPESGVTLLIQQKFWNYTERKYETKTLATLTSDRNGNVKLDKSLGDNNFIITLKKGDDLLLPNENYYVPTPYKDNSSYDITNLFTDRAIYRPGQTVYFKGIVTHKEKNQQALVPNYKETVIFKDANYQEISRATFTTDEYGSFNGSFVIPTNLLNGNFRLEANHGNVSITVEEYKRPTFEIHFESVKEQYKLNEEVTIHGSVDAYGGFGLDDVKYSYRVVRKTHFPWRCWWWWYPSVEDEQIDYGEARTDENGKFAVTFNLKPSLKTKPEQQPVFTYEIEVTATSAQGETHSDTYSIRAGYNEIALGTNIPSLVEQSKVTDYRIEVFNMSGQPAKSRVSRKIYRFDDYETIDFFETFGVDANLDRQVLDDSELATLFPAYGFHYGNYRMQHKTVVYEDEIDVDDKAEFYPGKPTLEPGKYYIELKSLDDPYAMISKEFAVYKENAKQLPYQAMFWDNINQSSCHPGDVVHYNIGTSAKNVNVWVKVVHGQEIRLEQWMELSDEVKEITYTVKEADRGGLAIKTAFVKENDYELNTRSISVPYDNYNLEVNLATMRDKLTPGAEETWTVTVKDYKGKPVESALLAGMYDASLDEFESHYWSFNMRPNGVWSDGFGCDNYRFTSSYSPSAYFHAAILFNFSLPSDYPFFDLYYGWGMYGRPSYRKYALGGAVMEEDAVFSAALEDRMDEAPVANELLVPSPSAPRTPDDADIEEEETETIGAEGDSSPSVRENFNETAFFFPDLRSDKDGNSTFTFTMPDAITRWKLMMLAHTKDSKVGQYTHEFTASKPVMIMADMPRFMYDTDTLWFVANVINTGDETVTPKAKLEIFDAATMEPIDLLKSDALIQMTDIVAGRSQEVRWKVAAKYDLTLLAFRFTAYAGTFSDAEQHLLPVLSSEIFMTQTLPITVKAETEKTFDFEAIANPDSHERDHSLTLNFSTNPIWYAVQSLPYLADVRTDRPENAFYVFYANSLSAYIADNVPNLLAYIKKWEIETPDALLSQLEKDQDLKAIMLQETPWVLEAKSETEQRSRIANLFELKKLREQQSETLALLERTQMYNGGWPWFEGMPESPYITTYILEGFGKLKNMNVWSSMSPNDQSTATDICEDAVGFLEFDVAETYRIMKKHKEEWGIGSFVLRELYALSFFEEQDSDDDFATAKEYFLNRLGKKKEWTKFDFNQRAFAAMVLYRNGDEKTAKTIIQSFKECAQKNEEIGMYWPKKYFSFISHIATHANIMSAFAEIDKDQEMLDQLRVWLLTQKRTNMWENSASTADAIYALLLRGSDWFAEGKDVTLRFGTTPIDTEGGEAGTGFIQRRWDADEVTSEMRQLTVNNPTEHLVWGGLFRQYFVPIDEVKGDDGGFNIKREIFVETVTPTGKVLVPIGKRTLKVGDKLTVKLTFESSQDMSFVFVKDLRAAGFEPINVISRYHYNDEMCYYQSTTDSDMEFFIDFLPKGIHQLEYSMYVTKAGNLSNGYALIQCLYAPEFCAYSDGMRISVE